MIVYIVPWNSVEKTEILVRLKQYANDNQLSDEELEAYVNKCIEDIKEQVEWFGDIED